MGQDLSSLKVYFYLLIKHVCSPIIFDFSLSLTRYFRGLFILTKGQWMLNISAEVVRGM